MALTITQMSDRGQVRPRNEDACAWLTLSPDGLRTLLIVADGMGGHSGGDIASDVAVNACRRSVAARLELGDPPASAVREGMEAANRAVLQAQSDDPNLGDMGTTLTVALICGDRIHVGHCGDSRAYLLQGDQVRQLTTDHSMVGELVKDGQITQDEAMVHPQRNYLTRALGMDEILAVESLEVTWRPHDIVLLCTDGLTNMVRAQEILQEAATVNFADLAQRLVTLANARGGPDNITVLAARWEG